MKTFNELIYGMKDVYLVSEEPKPNDYHFRFKDGVGHPDATDATVQSHSNGHDVNMVYKGHHIRASLATKTGNDPSSGSSSGIFRSLHITKGKKFDAKKLVYSHGASSLKVDPKMKEKGNDKVKEILPHIRNVAEHLVRGADRELDKHLQSKNKALKEEVVTEEEKGWEAFGEGIDGVVAPVMEDSEDCDQEMGYNKDVSNNYLKMYFSGSASKATTVLNKLKKEGKLKSFNIMGDMLLVQFRASERHDDCVMQDLSAVGVMDRGDQRPELKKEETEGHLYMSAALPHNTKTLFKGKVHSDNEAFKRMEALKPWMKQNGHSKMHVSITNSKTGETASHKVYADK